VTRGTRGENERSLFELTVKIKKAIIAVVEENWQKKQSTIAGRTTFKQIIA